MGNLLSTKKKSSTVTALDEAILNLKIARKQLVDQKRRQELLAERALATVQQLLRSEKSDRALVALRKRKLHEKQVVHVDSCILRIDEQLCSAETTSQQMAVMSALRTANTAIKEMQQQIKVEDIEKLMDESAEAKQYLEEVQAALGPPLETGEEEELEAELHALAEHMDAEQLAELPAAPKVPETASARAAAEPASAAQAEPTAGDAAQSEAGELDLPSAPTTAAVIKPQPASVAAEPALEEPLLA